MKKEFLERFSQTALLLERFCGIDGKILLAQSALETGWGRHVPGNNLFGIKKLSWLEGGQVLKTREFDGLETRDAFQVFKSPENSVIAYLILVKERYQEAWQFRRDPVRYFQALQRLGYATDPNYAKKCLDVYGCI